MAYEPYHHSQMQDYEYPVEKVAEVMTHLPKVSALAQWALDARSWTLEKVAPGCLSRRVQNTMNIVMRP